MWRRGAGGGAQGGSGGPLAGSCGGTQARWPIGAKANLAWPPSQPQPRGGGCGSGMGAVGAWGVVPGFHGPVAGGRLEDGNHAAQLAGRALEARVNMYGTTLQILVRKSPRRTAVAQNLAESSRSSPLSSKIEAARRNKGSCARVWDMTTLIWSHRGLTRPSAAHRQRGSPESGKHPAPPQPRRAAHPACPTGPEPGLVAQSLHRRGGAWRRSAWRRKDRGV